MTRSKCFMSTTLSGLNEAIDKWLTQNKVKVISHSMAITKGSMMNEYTAIVIYEC